MATLSATNPTLLDVTKRLDPDGRIDTIAEILTETNEILQDMTMMEGNLPTGHRTTMRTGLPQPTWRKLYGGVQPTKSTTAQITDTTGMLEAYAEVDKTLADLNGNTAAFRLSEDKAHIEGMNQEFSSSLFYASETTAPEEITGFAPRFNDLAAENAENIVQPTGLTGSNCSSIWLVTWGPNTCHGIYPKGTVGGLQVEDKGQVTIEDIDGSGGRMEAYRTHYCWKVGLTVRDWRYVVRIQFDSSTLTGDLTGGSADLVDLMAQAVEVPPNLNMGNTVMYCNRRTKSFLRRQIVEKVSNSTLSMDSVGGKHQMMFDGIPIRRVDSILNTETTVS